MGAGNYIETHELPIREGESLATKLSGTTQHLRERGALTKQQADPVLSATEKPGTYLSPSVTRLNQWVHNEYMFPGPADLAAEWNSLQS